MANRFSGKIGRKGKDSSQMFDSLAVEAKAPAIESENDTIRLKDIQPRTEDTRAINENHARSLMESIRVLGLIEPIVTDSKGVLLAGGRRHWALKKLIIEHPKDFEKHFPGAEIPVRRMNFNVADDEARALAIEIGENEHRRNYSADEIRTVAERLEKAGYKRIKGRQGKEDKPLMPVLIAAVGLSKRRINEILKADKEAQPKSERNRSLSESDKHLQKAIALLKKWEKGHGRKRREMALAKEIPSMIERLQQGLE